MSTSLFGNRRFLLGAFALSALAFFATANVRDGGALLGQAAPTYVPAIHAYTKAQCEKGVVIKANDHNQVRCEGTGAFPAFSGPLGNNEQIRFWGYEFTGDEPPFHGNFRISAGELKVNPKYQVINKLGNLRRGKAYYFMTEKDLFFRCGEGLSYVQACGNGVLEGNEQCDDGNIVDGDGCSKTCTIETVEKVCGNGIVEPGEECDDGNMQNGDGCSRTCTIEKVCGNGIVEEGEECDDGNQNNTDGCTTACRLPVCGDGYVQAGEACDDGNTEDGDGCSANCTVETIEDPEPEPVCGNGIVEEGEECDDGNFSDDDACTQNCTFTPCTDSDGSDIYTKGTTSGIRQGRLVRHTDSCFNRNM
ncbi:MAG: DUF4215 domain-containing protein, partial [Candidatus Peribacteraceae bacterium]|nr:DUF4215 domain-containing protein [Candidatus Peribacteraceae bacterium]